MWIFITVLPGLWLSACNEGGEETPCPPTSGTVIRWNVAGVDAPHEKTRSLVGPERPDRDWATLEEACTPLPGGEGKAVGIWADHTYRNTAGEEQTSKDIFEGTRLIYKTKTDGNPHSNWNYEGKDLYWLPGSYKFRAYFPQKLTDYVVSTSNATAFAIGYPTYEVQEDMVVAYQEVDTTDPQTDLGRPVVLNFKHTLAALRFRFQADYTNSDRLTSCWLQNTEAPTDDFGFSTGGFLTYGTETNKEQLTWSYGYRPPVTESIYKWSNEGVDFSTDNAAQQRIAATAYTAAGTTEGTLYTQNKGWLLILPQPSPGTLQLCFTTRNGGEAVYRITLPEITQQNDESVSYAYEAGKRYTYTVTISKTKFDLALSVADWNERNSSHEIIF